ncbi:MAG: diguanylate cyclase [Armatimonadetes bacterium]|nr:diguanylate cyclase [Armatimonadota bacterium]
MIYKILVVDDDDHIRKMIRVNLELDGYEVYEARDGTECIQTVQQVSPDLILLDVMIPVIDGFEACSFLKKDTRTQHVPVVFVSVKNGLSEKTRAFEEGAEDYVTKPFDPMELGLRIKSILKRSTHAQVKSQQLERLASRLARMNIDLRKQAVTDGLTSLFNHRYFKERLAEEISRSARYKRTLSVGMFDIDDFKAFNDKHGHLAGDRFLRDVAGVLRSCIRGVDLAARYGGEEFVLILPETSLDGAQIVAERVRERVASFSLEGLGLPKLDALLGSGEKDHPCRFSISAGVASFPEHAETPEQLIERADNALYSAKKLGKNRVILYDNKC